MKKTIATILFSSIILADFTMLNFAWAEQQCDPNKPETTPVSRFEINQIDGTAYDTKTKLSWKICAEGQNYSDGYCTNKATSYTYYDLVFPVRGSYWRLPNNDELKSIVEVQCQNPAINLIIFPRTQSLPYWGSKLAVNFLTGETIHIDNGYVRLVRGEEWIDQEGRKQAQQADLEARQRKAPSILRTMPKDDFCVAYGEAVRGEKINEIGVLPDIMNLVKPEVRRRKLVFNDSQIIKKQVQIGMSECQLYAAWGLPSEQNRSVGSWGVHIQHIFGSNYVYTENGRVTSWQD